MDVGLVYFKPSGLDGVFRVATPIDVRVGYVSTGRMMLESRFSMNFATGSGVTVLNFDPGLNALFKLGAGHGPNNRLGPYWTVGADAGLNYVKVSGAGSNGGMVVTVNGGIGTRMAWGGGGAKRIEGFVAYSFENNNLGAPNTFAVGTRLGLSLWH